jgi:hypothetical protein
MVERPDAARPPQRRDNGLIADRYVALADVDPRLGEHLLDLLRLVDIPAYLEPPADPRVAARYRISGPIERLYVQSALRTEARAVVVAAAAEAGPAPTPAPEPPGGSGLLDGLDTDAEFARIVADFSTPKPEHSAEAADVGVEVFELEPGADFDADDGSAASEINEAMLDAAAEQRAALDRARQARAEDPTLLEEHFEPPPPPPFPVPSPGTAGAVLLFLLGLFIIARGDLLGLSGDLTFPLGVITVLTGLGLLVARLRPSRGTDEDDDDGAVI